MTPPPIHRRPKWGVFNVNMFGSIRPDTLVSIHKTGKLAREEAKRLGLTWHYARPLREGEGR